MLIYRVCPTYDWEVIIKCLIVLIHFLTLCYVPGKTEFFECLSLYMYTVSI